MPATGIVYEGLTPLSAGPQTVPEPGPRDVTASRNRAASRGGAASMTEKPTLSHTLAQNALHHDVKGAAQAPHNGDVVDLGWNEPRENIAAPLVGGMNNEELWLLIRRFNKVCTILISNTMWNNPLTNRSS